MQNAAMLWTGGKDCSLALYEARRDGYEVRCLVTFAPPNPNFLAHPPAFIKLQAQALALPHHILSINEPFDKSYEVALGRLRDEMGIKTVITGDIAEVNGSPNWIRERSRPVGMKVHTPLWGRDRLALLRQLLDKRFYVIFSCVKTRWLGEAGLAVSWMKRPLPICGLFANEPALIYAARKANITRSLRTGRLSSARYVFAPFKAHHRFAGLHGYSPIGIAQKMTIESPCIGVCQMLDDK